MRTFLLGFLGLVTATVVGCSSASAEATAESGAAVNAGTACLPTLDCAAPATPPMTLQRWRHWVETPALVTTDISTGEPSLPYHRGRDLFVNPGAPQTIIAHFTYGLTNTNLEDEDVAVFVQRDCATGWEELGTATTTKASAPHPSVEGVVDGGGRVYFEVPKDKALGPGRHHVRLVVKGDGSSTDLFLDVVPARTPIFISDVDGTLTSSEDVEFAVMLIGVQPNTHPEAPEALRELAAKGYRPIYLTARPEWLVNRTREFLDQHGFPPGIVHTSTSFTGGGTGASAAAFKTNEMALLAQKGLVPTFGFGNMPSDSQAYQTIPQVKNRFFYQIQGDFQGQNIQAYNELLPELAKVAAVCQQ